MHWYWIDRFTHFESGKCAKAVKVVTMAEEHLAYHFPGFPVMPASLMIEGLAQVGGILIHETQNFSRNVVLGKIQKFHLYDEVIVPGDRLEYEVNLEYINDGGSMVSVSVHRDGELIADGALVFAHLSDDIGEGQNFFGDDELLQMVRVYGLFDVGTKPDGSPILDPALQGEPEQNSSTTK